MGNILDSYNNIEQISKMSYNELEQFSEEIRRFLIEKVSKTGGHLASNLGVVELTLSLYKVFDFNIDKLIWDVGHQSYVHKILTGRKDQFDTLRMYGGLSGFPKRSESKYDVFDTGHSSTSISAGIGIARARDILKDNYHVISIIGDGALTGGMALEALNDVGFRKTKMIVILNDNAMSISSNVGGLSVYLGQLRADPNYTRIKKTVHNKLEKSDIGKNIASSMHKIKDGIKNFVIPGMLFENMGLKYFGPVDGHNLKELITVIEAAKNIEGPSIIHVKTIKGKGFRFAEENPNKFHGIDPFNRLTGEVSNKKSETYSNVFGETIVKLAEKDDKIVAVTAAMPDGTSLTNFAKRFPERFFDVGIAEEHAVTMCAGIATCGLKPVFAVYSTFLQRAYDQVLHDVCIQELPVVFAIDRGGIVGNDGETHQGIFDISYLNTIPNMTIMSPKCTKELSYMLAWAIDKNYPIAIRYPRGGDNPSFSLEPLDKFVLGKWEELNSEGEIAIIAVGRMVQTALEVQEILKELEIKTKIISTTFIKPIDTELLDCVIESNMKIITIEDNILIGGLGSTVTQYVNSKNKAIEVLSFGYKDKYICHGDVDTLYRINGLDSNSIARVISESIKEK
ncbi:1-deoxy-D-xylulose-5-phosphate synthase [Clostridium cellulovorans]|uniref:1-deoxy-D-xylulose-5-phosphate synthase n=1 Tax=Clostridium cellulovorans (strain ATCC 35296 / DSM 3052 / OCM 3 / 743B) TaxID=573061 RepID=D9SLV0_CLOC7|nr:1-deoxy-D-xylulose-5-phosphate synthase [Clostridium cellulovorans]ADL51681.1 deoxyxylulose-5-phosphate synthase [Clostridium cellulovorans 743B]